MNHKHQNPMLAPVCRASSKSDRHTALRSGGILSNPTKESPSVEDGRLQQSPGGGAGGRARPARTTRRRARAGRKDLGFCRSPLPVPSRAPARLGLAASPALFADLPAWGFGEVKEGGRSGGRGAAFISRQAPAYTHGHGPSRSRRSERGDDPDEDQDGVGCGWWTGGHRHVMHPGPRRAWRPLLPRPAVFYGISQENEALVFFFFLFSWRGTHVRRGMGAVRTWEARRARVYILARRWIQTTCSAGAMDLDGSGC
jgi:hypothetical protein